MPESEIQQAIAPLVRSIDQLYDELRRINDKLDSYMTRAEYEPRNKTLENAIDKLNSDLNKLEERLERREEAARTHTITVILAIVAAIVSIVLNFWK